MMLPMFIVVEFLFVISTDAFTAFTPSIKQSASHRLGPLRAADGAPQYDKFDGVLREAEKVAEGSFMLHVDVAGDSNVKLDYQPGHVLALEMEDKSGNLNEDAKKNGGWMRGPYTVSRCTDTSFDVLVRVVGKKSRAFSESPPGTAVRFGGKFKVPILEGINKEETKKVILVSTGVGVGPCVGAIELALQDESFPPIVLFPSYKESSDVAFREDLDELASEHPSKLNGIPSFQASLVDCRALEITFRWFRQAFKAWELKSLTII